MSDEKRGRTCHFSGRVRSRARATFVLSQRKHYSHWRAVKNQLFNGVDRWRSTWMLLHVEVEVVKLEVGWP